MSAPALAPVTTVNSGLVPRSDQPTSRPAPYAPLEPPPEIASTLIAPSRPAATARTSEFKRASSASARSSDHTRAFGMLGILATACCALVEGIRACDAQPASGNSPKTITSFLDQAGPRRITENLDRVGPSDSTLPASTPYQAP